MKWQIKCNNGVKANEYWKGNGVYSLYTENVINGKHILIYYFNNRYFLEINGELIKKISVELEDIGRYGKEVFLKYVDKILENENI